MATLRPARWPAIVAWMTALALLTTGCAAVTAVGVRLLYRRAGLPEAQISRDVAYGTTSPRQRLDLYRPGGRDWPVILFLHGGNWDSGDKALRVGGADVYANIGRYYAGHGIGVAVANYRLQPDADWRTQVADVREAVRWLHAHIGVEGGDPSRVFVMGHSAGAQLATFAALDPNAPPIAGVIAVSGAGLDLTDSLTYALGEDPGYYVKRFGGPAASGDWRAEASPVRLVGPSAPPFLILYAGGEKPALVRQAELLRRALAGAGGRPRVVVVPGQSHSRIVLTLSRADRAAAPAILSFIARPGGP